MECSAKTRCSNPKISKWENEFFCFNCYQSFKKEENTTPERVNIYQCCETHDIYFGDLNDVCINCGTIHQKMLNYHIWKVMNIKQFYINRKKFMFLISI